MDFQLDIGELTNTINEYENFIKILSEQKENINKAVKELTDLGWSGEAKDKFLENHIKKQKFYTKLEEDIKYMKSALENDEKPKAVQLKKRSEDFENCIKRSGGAALTSDDAGVISLQYGGQFPINNNVNECTNDYYRRMNSKFEEILSLVNSLTFTSFAITGDVTNAENSLRDQTMSLTEFNNSFNVYCSDVRAMEDNICSVFSKISGITEGISKFRDVSIISENGQVDKNEVRQLMLKNPGELTAEENQILEYAKIVLGEDEYKKIKETIFTYEEAWKYIKCNVLGIDVGFKTYFPNEISNLPKQIVYKKDGYTYIYDLIQCPPPTFYGVELPNDDIVTKDGGVISNKLYGYKLVYTNEPVVLTGTVSVSPIKWKGKAKIIKGRGSATKGVGNTKPNQVHHFATNKSKKYTQQFENVANKYGLDLDDVWNKQLMPHQGRHPYAYHEYVLREMTKYDNIARGDKDKFLKLYEQLKNKVMNNPDMLTKDYWK
ncbi:AHH domain-containing protein [Clostridium tetanomorphum]|uniref:AHH domain-containing protein n=1 Tax=Clostridium tetanomorphum TaxID=1553 RepID=UPI001A9B5D03|nr:AHH domain-containing protein [Clostridium tetanomorphum]NRZ96919.1 hypothetical protein [Clostridium tetanomorphum]